MTPAKLLNIRLVLLVMYNSQEYPFTARTEVIEKLEERSQDIEWRQQFQMSSIVRKDDLIGSLRGKSSLPTYINTIRGLVALISEHGPPKTIGSAMGAFQELVDEADIDGVDMGALGFDKEILGPLPPTDEEVFQVFGSLRDVLPDIIQADTERVWIINSFLPESSDFIEALSDIGAKLIGSEDKFRIIMMDPNSRHIEARADQLPNQRFDTVKSLIDTTLLNLTEKFGRPSTQWLRVFDGLISAPMFLIDNDWYVGKFLFGALGIDSFCAKIPFDSSAGQQLKEHFNNMWKHSVRAPKRKEQLPFPALPHIGQAFHEIFPNTPLLDQNAIEATGEVFEGFYRFGRLRAALDEKDIKSRTDIFTHGIGRFIVGKNWEMPNGKYRLRKYRLESDCAFYLYYQDIIPSARYGDKNWRQSNRMLTRVLLLEGFLFIVGDEHNGKAPTVLMLRIPTGLETVALGDTFDGLMLRRHPQDEAFATRIVFQKIKDLDDRERDFNDLSCLHELMDPKKAYLTYDEFQNAFPGVNVQSLMNVPSSITSSSSIVPGVLDLPPFKSQ